MVLASLLLTDHVAGLFQRLCKLVGDDQIIHRALVLYVPATELLPLAEHVHVQWQVVSDVST